MNKKGSVLILFIPAVAVLFLWTLMIARWGRALYTMEKARSIAEQTVLSSLRITIKDLERLVERWGAMTPLLGAADQNGVEVQASNWPMVEQISSQLKNSLWGYKIRIKSIGTVIAQANGIDKSLLTRNDPDVFDLGIVPQGQWIIDSSGSREWAEDFWLQRTWDKDRRLGEKLGEGTHSVRLSDPFFGTMQQSVTARIQWDVLPDHSFIRAHGNGGFPRNWNEAVLAGKVDPFRYPFFRTEVRYE